MVPRCAPLFVTLFLGSFVSEAAVVQVAGTFSATFDTLASDYQGIPSLSGSWSLTYDNATTPVNGFIDNAPLTTLTLSQSIGGVTFSPANASARIYFDSGSLYSLVIGGNVSGVTFVDANDFSFGYYYPTRLTEFAIVNTAPATVAQLASTLSGTIAIVPEVSTSGSLAIFGAFGLLVRKRSRSK